MEPHRIGTVVWRSQATEEALYNDEPVAATVGRVVAVVLLAQGFSVIDHRRTAYEPRAAARGTRVAITGEVQEFSFRRSEPRSIAANVQVRLRVHNAERKGIVWERRYSDACRGQWYSPLLGTRLSLANGTLERRSQDIG